jgi:hypothetical protein
VGRINTNGNTRFMALFVAVMLLLSTFVAALAPAAQAKSTRAAVAQEVTGNVTVKKSGGSKSYSVYKDMTLNQGDLISTGSGASLVVQIVDTGDELTVGEDSEIYISELAESSGGKSSKLKSWAGSMWNKVKSLVSSDDEFEVETPTAVMGVRGTQFYVYTNPFTGRTTMIVAAGIVRASTVTSAENEATKQAVQEQKSVLVYPSQQIDLSKRDEVKDLRTKVDVIDVDQLVKQAPPKVLETIIKNKADIDKENAEFLEKQKQVLQQGAEKPKDSILTIKDQNELDRVAKNLDHIVGNVAKQAIEEKKLEQKQVEKLADEVNKTIVDPNKKLDITKVQALDKTAGIDPEVEKLKAEQRQANEAERLRQEQEALRLQQELQARLDAILKQAEAEKQRLDELNKKAVQELQKQAEQQFVSQLTPTEKTQYETKKTENLQSTTTGTTTGTGTVGGGQTVVDEPTRPAEPTVVSPVNAQVFERGLVQVVAKAPVGTKIKIMNGSSVLAEAAGNGDTPVTISLPDATYSGLTIVAERAGLFSSAKQLPSMSVNTAKAITLKQQVAGITPATASESAKATVQLGMKNFTGEDAFYAVEAHLLYSKNLSYKGPLEVADTATDGTVFTGSQTAETLKEYAGTTESELVYAGTQFVPTGGTQLGNISVTTEKPLVTIPLSIGTSALDPEQVKLIYVKVVKLVGNQVVTVYESTSEQAISVTTK